MIRTPLLSRFLEAGPAPTRRAALGTAALGLAALAGGLAVTGVAPVLAQSAPAPLDPAEIVFGVVPYENAGSVTDRYGPLVEHLRARLNRPVTLRIATDYAAVIEGQRAGQIHIATYGPSAFARALMIGARVEAFMQDVNADGSRGYHSVFYVRADSPYGRIEDLRGKSLALVDPNSTTGNAVPRFALSRMGLDADGFFGRVVYAGSHENAILALRQGTVDVAANWWNDERTSNLSRMAEKGMVKAEEFRMVFKSEAIINAPTAYLADLTPDLKTRIRDAFLNLPAENPAAWASVSAGGQQAAWAPVDNAAYAPVVELNRFVDELRRKRS